jgi:hypothetical protein
MEEIGRLIGGLASVYFLFDFFFWNGGLVNPSILQRISNVMTLAV